MPTYTPQSSTIGVSLGSPPAWIAWAKTAGIKRLDEFEKYVKEIYRLCKLAGDSGPQAHKLIVQMLHETGNGTSFWWTSRLNPAGIGITGDPKQNEASKTFVDGIDAARAHLYHYWLYTTWPLPEWAEIIRVHDPRRDALPERFRGSRKTLASFGGSTAANPTWAADPRYGQSWANRLNELEPIFKDEVVEPTPPPAEEKPPMALPKLKYYTVIPGLEGGPLGTNHRVVVKLLPIDGYQRPGKAFYGNPILIQHGTGNSKSMAPGEAIWLVDQKASGNQQSYHYITDDGVTYVCLPLDEHGWHAADGNGPGNLRGIANELVENSEMWASPARAAQAVENAAEIMGRTHARKSKRGATGPKQHWDFNYALPPSQRHDCPNKLRYGKINGRPAWQVYVERYNFYLADELVRMGEISVPTAIFKAGDTIAATGVVNIRQAPTTAATSKILGRTVNGQTVKVLSAKESGQPSIPVYADGYQWYSVEVSPTWGTGWVAGELFEKVTPPAPKPVVPTFDALRDIQVLSNPKDNKSVVGTLTTGTKGEVIDTLVINGVTWYDIKVTGFGTGWVPSVVQVPTVVVKK